MSTLKTNNFEHLDASSPNITLGIGGGVNISGIATAESGLNVTSGNIGIGTDNPQQKLHLKGIIQLDGTTTAINDNYSRVYQNSSGSVDYGLQVKHYQGDTDDVDAAIILGGNGSSREGNIVFYRDVSGTFTETARFDENGRLGIGTNNPAENVSVAGTIRVQDSADATQYLTINHQGIDFQNTGAGSSTTSSAHLLDDYEEGTWTPAFIDLLGGTLSATYSTQTGSYTKVGNTVTCTAIIVTSSVSGTGLAIGVSGLPFACFSSPGTRSSGCIGNTSGWSTRVPTNVLTALSSTNLQLRTVDYAAVSNNVEVSHMTSTTRIDLTVSYFVD